MSELNLWQGGIKIIPQENMESEMQATEIRRGRERFDTCKYKTFKEIVKRTCCSSKTEKDHYCESRQIFHLNYDTCATCAIYDPKLADS